MSDSRRNRSQKLHLSVSRMMDRLMLPDDTAMATVRISLAGLLYLIFDAVMVFLIHNLVLSLLLMQGQLAASVYLTLRFRRSGYFIALCLNTLALIRQIYLEQTGGSIGGIDPIFGMLFYFDVLIAGSLVAFYAIHNSKNYDHAMKQKELIATAYYQASVSEEKLWKKNQELEKSNKIITSDKEKMYQLANVDLLTQLPNRRKFQIDLDQIAASSLRSGRSFALAFIDFDNFKSVNDTLGHQAGDELIRYSGFLLSKLSHSGDALGHIGGDEFVLIIRQQMTRVGLQEYMGNISKMVRRPIMLGNATLSVSASIGIAVFPQDTSDVSELMRFADLAMYRAKKSGKNQILFFERTMSEQLVKETQVIQGLKGAIVHKELFLVFQPQYFVESGGLRGFETLIRWKSPVFGRVSPATFIPLAERNGIIGQLGRWVMRTACKVFRQIQVQYGFLGRLAINVSPVQLMEPDFINDVKQILKETSFDPHCLEIEITETSLSDSIAVVSKKMDTLKDMGIVMALDDFGTGYSSLSYLQQLPIDLVKIDKSFIDKINQDIKSNQFVSSILSIVHQLNIPSLAEGVENEWQKEFLRTKKCDMIQGYLYSKPVTADGVLKLLRPPEGGNSLRMDEASKK
jgi:diguanylate cyclase (GGDEF) domain